MRPRARIWSKVLSDNLVKQQPTCRSVSFKKFKKVKYMKKEETGLTLDEKGLDAVADYLRSVTTEKPRAEKKKEDMWEPPIDNETGGER